MDNTEDIAELQNSLLDLHGSVSRLIKAFYDNVESLENREAILDVLPLLDFYNDDLAEQIIRLNDAKA